MITKDDKILKLTDYQHARLRTPMYLGSTSLHTDEIILYENNKPYLKELSWVPAIYTAFREVVDNALDELAHGYGNRIDIDYDVEKGIVSVQDNGRGIPFDHSKEFEAIIATTVLTTARSGRNFGERELVAGTNGLGISVVNFCSEWFKVDIWRNKKSFSQKFTEGKEELNIEEHKIKRIISDKSGTRIQFKLSDKVFKDKTLPEEFVAARVYEVALCNPLTRIYYNGERIKVRPSPEKTLFSNDKPIIIEIKEGTLQSKFILKSNFQDSGEYVHTIVNNIPAFNGGVHVENFRRFFYSGLLNALARESKRRKLQPNRSDINDGLLIYNVTNMNAPDFDSQSKTRLINEDVGKIIKINLEDDKIFKSIISKNKDWIEEIYARCAARTEKKEARETSQLAKKLMRSKVPDLIDATGKDRSKCILFLAEGQSAISGMTSVRDPDVHGGLGLRGKVMNVNGESPKKVLDSQALANIMNSVGLIPGEKADRNNMRYSKIYIAHDMDHDGLNIGALLVNFFYTYWPELFDPKQNPVFYVFMTPFIIAEKGKERKYWYAKNHNEFDPEEYKNWAITRAKGLGTLTQKDWRHSLQNPELYPLIDDGKIEEALDLIFNGGRAADRRTWIGL